MTGKIVRGLRALVAGGALLTLGMGSASAYTWASSSSPKAVSYNGITRGAGYGSLSSTSYNSARLRSYLKDHRVDSMRTYVDVYGNYGNYDIGTQSGRRSDGGASYALMADKTLNSAYPYGVQQYSYQVKVCMDRSKALDPCSSPNSWHSGL